MAVFYLVHGFNVKDGGAGTTDRFIPLMEERGHQYYEIDYGWMGLAGVRMCNKRIAKAASRLVQPGSIGIGHSNGCAILMRMAEYGAPFDGLILINPALDKDRELPEHINWANVYHNRGDKPVKGAKFLPGHPWGEMGNTGYQGDDERYVNFDTGPDGVLGHSAIFRFHWNSYGDKILDDATESYNKEMDGDGLFD